LTNRIDRYALVNRHNPVIRELLPLSPQSVGNGEFAFTADLTGLQSFPDQYVVPLGTQSNWGWHSTGGRDRYTMEDVRLQYFQTYGREVGYASNPHGTEESYHWLRQNPHRLQLGQIGLELLLEDGSMASIEHLEAAEQVLQLWEGKLVSTFRLNGIPVQVYTWCHPEQDQLAVKIVSPLIQEGRLRLKIDFPSQTTADKWEECIHLTWDGDRTDRTSVIRMNDNQVRLERALDEDSYAVQFAWSTDAELVEEKEHHYRLIPSHEGEELTFVAAFGKDPAALSYEEVASASRNYWKRFWSEGAAVELWDSQDPRARELERRVVLSQYLTAIHSAGSIPPQETGLMYNSWYGKPHLEMHWWHSAQFPLWGRAHLLLRSMNWYSDILPVARSIAASQGYRGARWPKMVSPDGAQSPSNIATLLIWQQPHPIMLAELCFQANPSEEVLKRYWDIVMESAEFMADFAVWDEAGDRYVLGPPVIPVQENHAAAETINPTFELEYWLYGLEMAQTWRERVGQKRVEKWDDIILKLSRPAVSEKQVYLAHDHCPDTYTRFNHDHPSMLMAFGVMPGRAVDPQIMRNTLLKVKEEWQWDKVWGWDFPVAAMTAARLGDGHLAVDLLLADQVKNTYMPNGHNYQREGLYSYLPGNGGLLTAVAMMACGWEGAPSDHAPGFPQDGSWIVRWEGLHRML
jgi:protein-glucosylgalactosylhydroxylysine glucosidase